MHLRVTLTGEHLSLMTVYFYGEMVLRQNLKTLGFCYCYYSRQ